MKQRLALTIAAFAASATVIAQQPAGSSSAPSDSRFAEAWARSNAAAFARWPELRDPQSPMAQEVRKVAERHRNNRDSVYLNENAPMLLCIEAADNLAEVNAATERFKARQKVAASIRSAQRNAQEQSEAAIAAERERNRARNIGVRPSSNNPLEDLARQPGEVGDIARERLAHPPRPLETPEQYARRRRKEKMVEAGTWTKEDELAEQMQESSQQVAEAIDAQTAEVQRQAQQLQRSIDEQQRQLDQIRRQQQEQQQRR